MKASIMLKTLAAALLISSSSMSYGSVYYDNVTTSFNLAVGKGKQQQYVGYINEGTYGGGVYYDTWTINLLSNASVMVDITTSTDTDVIDPQNLATAIAQLDNLTRVELWDSLNNVVGGANATHTLTNFAGGLSTLDSNVTFQINKFLNSGTYYLKIFGDEGTGYKGTVSAVPLPGAALLFGSVLLGAGALRRKQAKSGEMAAA